MYGVRMHGLPPKNSGFCVSESLGAGVRITLLGSSAATVAPESALAFFAVREALLFVEAGEAGMSAASDVDASLRELLDFTVDHGAKGLNCSAR